MQGHFKVEYRGSQSLSQREGKIFRARGSLKALPDFGSHTRPQDKAEWRFSQSDPSLLLAVAYTSSASNFEISYWNLLWCLPRCYPYCNTPSSSNSQHWKGTVTDVFSHKTACFPQHLGHLNLCEKSIFPQAHWRVAPMSFGLYLYISREVCDLYQCCSLEYLSQQNLRILLGTVQGQCISCRH